MSAKLLVFASTAGLVCMIASARAEVGVPCGFKSPPEQATGSALTGGNPADEFLAAYSECQKAEKAEAAGDFHTALQEYKRAAQLIEHVAQQAPQWKPSIIEFRRKRTSEAISRLSQRETA